MRVASFNVSWRAGAAAFLVVGLSTAAPDARAQQDRVTVAGRMASSIDRSDLYGVLVAIPALRIRARSDSAGLFRLAGVKTGTYDITFRRIGYHRVARTIDVSASKGVFDLGTFLLAPTAVQLEDVIVSATGDRYRRLESRRRAATGESEALRDYRWHRGETRTVGRGGGSLPEVHSEVGSTATQCASEARRGLRAHRSDGAGSRGVRGPF